MEKKRGVYQMLSVVCLGTLKSIYFYSDQVLTSEFRDPPGVLVVGVVQVGLGREEELTRSSDTSLLERAHKTRAVGQCDLRLALLLPVDPAALVHRPVGQVQHTLSISTVLNPVTLFGGDFFFWILCVRGEGETFWGFQIMENINKGQKGRGKGCTW